MHARCEGRRGAPLANHGLSDRDRAAAVALALQIGALWPAWAWYAARLRDVVNEPWGLLALVAALVLPGRRRPAAAAPPHSVSLAVPAAIVTVYALSHPFVPSLLSTLLAMSSVGVTWSLWRHGTPWPGPRWGLVMLSVPMLTSVHFYLGFPLRVVTGTVATVLLRLAGFNVVREGVCLKWAGRLVMVDPPCSGVRMLWAALFLVLALAARRGLGPGRALRAAGGAAVVVVTGNALRTTALFFPEAGVLKAPAGFHEAVGVAVFLAAALAIGASTVRPRATAVA